MNSLSDKRADGVGDDGDWICDEGDDDDVDDDANEDNAD
jgi:hypothetical protein